MAANIVWVFVVAYVFFWIVEKLIGNRVSAEVELQGLDVPEMGVLGYINEDPKTPEGHLTQPPPSRARPCSRPAAASASPSSWTASSPADLTTVWETVCKPNGDKPSPDFLAVYPDMTTFSGNRFDSAGATPIRRRRAWSGFSNSTRR